LNVSDAIYVDRPLKPGYHVWSDFLLENNVTKIPIFLQIAGNDILKQDLPDLALEFYGFALKDRSVIDSALIPVRLDLKNKNLKGRLPSSGLKAWNVLLADEGPITVRFVIANWKTGEISTATSHLDINGSALTVTNVFFPSLNLDWIIWPTPGDAQNRRGISVKYPYSVGYDLFFPDLTPQLSKSEKGRFFYFKIYNKSADSKNPPIHVRFTDGQNQPVEISDFALGQKPNALSQEGMELFWKILSLPDVAPGSYQFQVDILDPLNGQHLRRETGVQVQ
jgi:hypothetical protein